MKSENLSHDKWLTFDNDKNKMFCKSCIDAGLSNNLTSGSDKGCSLEPDYGVPQGGVPKLIILTTLALSHPVHTAEYERVFS